MPERPLDTSVSVHTPTRLQEFCPRVENSRELEVEEDLEVSRSNPNSLSFIYLVNNISFNSLNYSGLRVVEKISCRDVYRDEL